MDRFLVSNLIAAEKAITAARHEFNNVLNDIREMLDLPDENLAEADYAYDFGFAAARFSKLAEDLGMGAGLFRGALIGYPNIDRTAAHLALDRIEAAVYHKFEGWIN